jgi:hypothetical protein
MGELKPCPWCGSILKVLTDYEGIHLPGAYVKCTNRKCPCVISTKFCKTEEEAIEVWNRRAE